jgi:hypothetical protein
LENYYILKILNEIIFINPKFLQLFFQKLILFIQKLENGIFLNITINGILVNCDDNEIKNNILKLLYEFKICFPILSSNLNSGRSLFPILLKEITKEQFKIEKNLILFENNNNNFNNNNNNLNNNDNNFI